MKSEYLDDEYLCFVYLKIVNAKVKEREKIWKTKQRNNKHQKRERKKVFIFNKLQYFWVTLLYERMLQTLSALQAHISVNKD